MRATLSAIEGELALAMCPPRRLAASRLRLLLLAVKSSALPLEDALRSLHAAPGAATAACMTRPPGGRRLALLGGPCRLVVALLTLAVRGVWPGPLMGTRPGRSSLPCAHRMRTYGPAHPHLKPLKVENDLL